MDNDIKEKQWYNYPIVFFAGVLVIYTASSSIFALINL